MQNYSNDSKTTSPFVKISYIDKNRIMAIALINTAVGNIFFIDKKVSFKEYWKPENIMIIENRPGADI